jgi:hypothetical protein
MASSEGLVKNEIGIEECETCHEWFGKHKDGCEDRPGAIADAVLTLFRAGVREAIKEPNPAWLIEIEAPMSMTLYYCDEGDWCSNPNHAHRFATRDEATAVQSKMRSDLTRVAEHEWADDPSREPL